MKLHDHGLFGIESTQSFGFFGKRKKTSAWVEESFTFESVTGRHRPLPNSGRHVGSSLRARYLYILGGLIALALVLIISRLVYLQMFHGNAYLALAEGNRHRDIPIPAERGLIFDRNGVQLTKNIPKLSLALIPQELPRDAIQREKIIRRLSAIIEKDTTYIRGLLDEYGTYSYDSIVLEENIPYEQALAIDIAAADLPGIGVEQGSKRLYLQNVDELSPGVSSSTLRSLSHVLGYAGKLDKEELQDLRQKGYLPNDSIGKTGVEKTYEKELRGTYGVRRREVDVLEREQKVLTETPPKPGSNLFLSIDIQMQHALEQALQRSLRINNKARGAAVAMDPQTGAILALVSLPAFDNNDFSGGISSEKYSSYIENEDNPLFNRAISGSYPSGSTIKPAVAAAALQEGVITPRTTFRSVGGLAVGQWFFPDWRAGGHGATAVRKSIAWSVNTFYYYIGGGYKTFSGLGVDKITYYLRRFGIGDRLGIDLPGEATGFLPSRDWKLQAKNERWYIGDTYNLSIGQGDLLATPLQIAAMTTAVANGGTVYVPHVASYVQDPQSEERVFIEPIKHREAVVDTSHITVVRNGMRDCVTYGSCRSLANMPVAISGKTGTAQWSNAKEPHAWFTSFAPHDSPEIVVTVLVEEGVGGSQTATPVAREFYAWWSRYRLNTSAS